MSNETGMSGLQRKKLALKALKELKRTNPDAYAASRQEKTERQARFKRYLVQAKRGEIWTTLDSTDDQGEAIQCVIEIRWAKLYPDVSWKVVDSDWLKAKRKKSTVMWVVGDNPDADTEKIVLPTPPLFPLESFVRVTELENQD